MDCAGPAFLGGEYLIKRYAISYAPSLTVLKYARALARDVLPDSLFLALDERLLATLTAGDEIVGLTRAFICAGTPSVL